MSNRGSLYRFTQAIEQHHLNADLETFLGHSQQFRLPAQPEDPAECQRRIERDRKREAACRQRQWLHDHLSGMPLAPGQQSDTHLAPYVGLPALAKGQGVFTKVMAGDYEIAEALSKETRWPFQVCLDAIIKVNRLSTLSFEGGDKIEKQGGSKVKKSKLAKRMKKAAEFATNYKMTGADPELDKAVWSMHYRATAQRIGQRPGQPVSNALGLLTAGRR